MRAAVGASGESKAARVNLGKLRVAGVKVACGLALPCGASKSTGDISLMTFSLEARRTSACLMADSAADSDSTGVTHSESETESRSLLEPRGELLPADSMLAVATALGGRGSGLVTATDSGLAKSVAVTTSPLKTVSVLLGLAAATTDDDAGSAGEAS